MDSFLRGRLLFCAIIFPSFFAEVFLYLYQFKKSLFLVGRSPVRSNDVEQASCLWNCIELVASSESEVGNGWMVDEAMHIFSVGCAPRTGSS